jgi:hypothetical protein
MKKYDVDIMWLTDAHFVAGKRNLVTRGKRIPEMLTKEIDRSNQEEIENIGALVDTAIIKSSSQVILSKRGDDGDTPTIHESSAALGMICFQAVEVVGDWKTYLTFYTIIIRMAYCN